MKFNKYLTAIAITAMALISCEEETTTIGGSLTSPNDNLKISSEEYNVLTSSFIPDSVYSYSDEWYLGEVKDPETNTIVKSAFMSQYNMMEETHLPALSQIRSLEGGEVIADSCAMLLFFDHSKTFGDTLAAMKLKVSELDRPVEDGVHYTNFDPKSAGYIREDGLKKYQTFTMANMNWSDSLRNAYSGMYFLRINLNDPYTAKDGTQYKNYGSYILSNYYKHPEYFKNSYAFIHNVCPGFYFETIDGQGLMASFDEVAMRVYYRYHVDTEDADSIYISYLGMNSTQEVLQTINVKNDKQALQQLTEDNNCTFLKTPAGIFTEVTLPVDEIKQTHANDSLLSASVAFNRLNNQESITDFTFDAPSQVLLIEKDSVDTFFENNRNYNNRYAFYAALSKNAYSFSSGSDISNLIVRMYNAKQEGLKTDPDWVAKHPNWNKAMLIPVNPITTSTTSSSSYYTSTTTSTPIAMAHEMGLKSTRLVRGTTANPIKIRVIYAKFND